LYSFKIVLIWYKSKKLYLEIRTSECTNEFLLLWTSQTIYLFVRIVEAGTIFSYYMRKIKRDACAFEEREVSRYTRISHINNRVLDFKSLCIICTLKSKCNNRNEPTRSRVLANNCSFKLQHEEIVFPLNSFFLCSY